MKGVWNLAKRVVRPSPVVGATPAEVVFTENKWRLLRYRQRPEGLAFQTPLLMIPSLINRHYVLDLMPGKSFVEWLVARGHDVWIVDWGTPTSEDRYITFDEIVDGYLGRAIRRAALSSPRGKTHVLGYCLGGTLAAIHGAAHPERLAGLVALAAPIRFGDHGLLERWSRSGDFDLRALVNAFGVVPWPLLQASFHLLRPTSNLSKAVHVLDRAWDDPFLDGFFALEKWANDNVSFPGEAYVRYLQSLYRDDQLAQGTFSLSGRPVKLSALRCPTLAVTFQNDTIVPAESAQALIELAGATDKQELRLSGGHVGAVVSKAASGKLWPAVSNWLAARDSDEKPQ